MNENERRLAMRRIADTALAACLVWEEWPGINFFQGPEMDLMLSDNPHPLFNAVLRSHLPEYRVTDAIPGALRLAQARNTPLSWFLYPEDTPPDLGERLAKEGFLQAGESLGMLRRLESPLPGFQAPQDMEEVADAAAMTRFTAALAPHFALDRAAAEAFAQIHQAVGLGPESAWRHFLLTREGKAAATVSVFTRGDTAALANLCVGAEHRGQGLGRAMTQQALAAARQGGCQAISLLANPGAAKLFADLGFEEAGTVQRFFMAAGAWKPAPKGCCEGCSGCGA